MIAGVSLSMPDIVSRIEMGTSSGFETAATILGGSTALGYIVVGLLAFVLGVCVTVLCFRIRRLNEEEQTGEQKGKMQMEVISNLLQAAVTLLGFFLGGIRYLKSRKQEYFLLTCFYGCFFLGLSTGRCICSYFPKRRRSLCVRVRLGSKCHFPFHAAIHTFFGRRKEISVQEGLKCCPDRCSAVYILLHLWRYPLQSALVRYDDRCFHSSIRGLPMPEGRGELRII